MMKIIITNTDVGSLIKLSNTVLSKYGRDEVPERIRGQAVLSALKHLFGSSFFDICAVDRLQKTNNVVISDEHYDFMRTLHCVNWNKMHDETREYISALLIDYFKGNIIMANTNI